MGEKRQAIIVGIYNMKVLVRTGSDITETITEAINMAKKYACKVIFNFNGENIEVCKDSVVSEVYKDFNERKMGN